MDWEHFYNHFRQPDFISGYEIGNRLGGGAFGDVYKARKQSIGKSYAIKFLKLEDDQQREAVQRELAHVQHFAAIDHPNLVTIEDMGTVSGVPYLIMGYAGEETLALRLKSGPLPLDDALNLFRKICAGVIALHDRKLVHFDLKPSNVFLKGDVPRVGDYGLSKLLTDGRTTLSFGRGTPQYMAPEILRQRADHRADIYSLGVILFECLSGRVPFEPSEGSTLVLREDDAPPNFGPEIPESVRGFVRGCLRLAPDDRYASVAALLSELGGGMPGTAAEGGGVPAARHAEPEVVPAPDSGPPGAATALTGVAAQVSPAVPDQQRPPSTFLSPPTPPTLLAPAAHAGRALDPVRHTVPVPPQVEGGALGALLSNSIVSMEVLLAMMAMLAQGIVLVFHGLSDQLLRRGGGVLRRSLGVLLFLLLMIVLGFGLMTAGLGLLDNSVSAPR